MKYVCNEPFWKFKKLPGNESYCTVCKKNIVDFRDYSTAELAAYKAQNTEAICGVFTSEQAGVNADTVYGTSVYKIMLASLISFFTFSFSESKAQTVKDSLKIEQYPITKKDTVVAEPTKEPVNEKVSENNSPFYSNKHFKKRGKTIFRIGRFKMVTRFPFFRNERRWIGCPSDFW